MTLRFAAAVLLARCFDKQYRFPSFSLFFSAVLDDLSESDSDSESDVIVERSSSPRPSTQRKLMESEVRDLAAVVICRHNTNHDGCVVLLAWTEIHLCCPMNILDACEWKLLKQQAFIRQMYRYTTPNTAIQAHAHRIPSKLSYPYYYPPDPTPPSKSESASSVLATAHNYPNPYHLRQPALQPKSNQTTP